MGGNAPMDETEQKRALIVGASRGLGLGLALELLTRGWLVTATVRSAGGGTGLEAFHEQVTMDTLDINQPDMVAAFVARAKAQLFDLVFINAGISLDDGGQVQAVSAADVSHIMLTNAVSPVKLAYELAPMTREGTGIVAFMTSILGSVALASGSWPVYSASKAALNMLTRGFAKSVNERDVTVLNLHPGWVRTDMGGANADIDVQTSVTGLANVLESKAGAGGHEFLDYTGKTLPW
jgi:NAD(P)-dependent dehydrogenase (short-subunit alcohol dehydrogenase family)